MKDEDYKWLIFWGGLLIIIFTVALKQLLFNLGILK